MSVYPTYDSVCSLFSLHQSITTDQSQYSPGGISPRSATPCPPVPNAELLLSGAVYLVLGRAPASTALKDRVGSTEPELSTGGVFREGKSSKNDPVPRSSSGMNLLNEKKLFIS